MKRIVVLLVVLVMVLSACDIAYPWENVNVKNMENESENPNVEIPSPTIVQTEEHDVQNVEENINAEDLTEDLEMTEEAQNQNINEESTGTEDISKTTEKTDDGENIIYNYDVKIPEDIVLNLQYDKYQVLKSYILIQSAAVNIREKPTSEAKIVGGAQYFEKVALIAEVKGQYLEKYGSDSWYKVTWTKDNEAIVGYIFSKLAEPREFQFDKMHEDIKKLQETVENNLTAYISNYKDRNGTAPTINGSTIDAYGIRRYQSAPAYYEANKNSSFRYIADGVLVSVLAETDSYYKISALDFEGEYYVPKRYVKFGNSIEKLTKVIVVDRKNQNEGIFEFIDGKWNLISYIYATTGEKAQYKLPTDLGYYMAIEKREKFLYLDDETKQVAGYAPFATRFSGGAYIHGVPVDFTKETVVEIVDGTEVETVKLVDPGKIEYLFTIGTTPRSHKCVRNYTSHAEFLYNWVEIGSSAVIVIE